MSRTIDEQIVRMEFDNKDFEKNVSTSINSINKLKHSLDLDGATKGLAQIDKAVGKVDVTPLGTAVETVKTRFSALEIVAVTALVNITNSAVNAGKRLISSLSIDQVTAGWNKYEQKTSSVQTIMNSTGKSIDEVNKYLSKLMWFSDETSYGFTDMTAALGQMTSAGGDIEKLIPLITGVANATAYAGKGASEFSRVIYNLNQSYGAGYLQLMDWKSVELAGVGSKQLKETLIATAEQLGKIKKGQVTVANFSETLKDKWADTEVMEIAFGKFGEFSDAVQKMVESGEVDTAAQAIEKLSGKYGELGEKAFKSAQEAKSFSEAIDATKDAVSSGWLNSAEIIFGNYEEAKVIWTDLANTLWEVFASGAEARNEMLEGWKELGGRTALIDSIKNSFNALVAVVTPIKEAFREFFPKTTAEQLFNITKSFEKLTARFREWAETSKTADRLKRTFKGLFAALDIGLQIVKAIANGFKILIKYISPFGGKLLDFAANLGDTIVKLRDFVKAGDVFNKIVEKISLAITTIVGAVKDFVSDIAKSIKEFAGIDSSSISEFTDTVAKRFAPLTKLFESVIDGIRGIADVFKTLFKFLGVILIKAGMSIGNGISKIIDKFDDLEFGNVVDNFNKLLSSGILLTIEAFFIKLLSITDDVGGFISSFTEIFENIGDVLQSFSGKLKAEALMKIATAIAVLVAAIFVLSTIEPDKVASSLTSISVLFIELMGSISLFLTITKNKKGIIGASQAMTQISIAILILAVALSKIAKLDTKGAVTGFITIGLLLTMMIATVKLLSTEAKNTKKMTKGLMSLVVMAVAIRVLAGAVEKLSSIDGDKLCNGLTAIGILLAELAISMTYFTNNLGKNKMGAFKVAGLLIVAAAIYVLASAVKKLGSLDFNTLSNGLIGVGILLAGIVAFTKCIGNPKKFISTTIGITILSASLLILAEAVYRMGNMSWEQIGKGLLTIANALAAVAIMLHIMPKNLTSKGVGLVIIASSLLILGSALSNMGGMSWGEMGRALITLSVSLAAIVVAMKFMTTAIPGALAMLILAPALMALALSLRVLGSMSVGEVILSLVALAGAFAVLGVAAYVLTPIVPIVLALGAAMLLLGVACVSIGAGVMAFAAGCASLAVSGAAGAAAVRVMVESFLGLIPLFIKSIGDFIVAILKVIADSGKAILDALTVVLLAIIRAIEQSIPPLIKCLGVLLDSLLQFIVEYIPKIVDAGMKLILGLLKGIADNIEEVVEEGANIVINFINGIARKIPEVIQSGVNLIISFINGIANAIRNNTKPMIDAVDNLMDAALEAVGMWFEDFREDGRNLIDGLIKGVKDAAKDLWNAMVGVVEDAWEGVKDFFGIHSPATAGIEAGKFIDKGLAVGLEKFAGTVSKSAIGVGESAMDSLSEAISGVSEMVSDDMDSTPVITPVIDLTEIQNGEKQLSRMLGKDHTISVNSANIKAASISSGRIAATSGNNANNTAQQGAQFSFTQNNYSPKALSRSDIYRQTKNQFSAMKGALVGS